MQRNNDKCDVCGNNIFSVMDGAFICDECGIQSQTIREEQVNFNENIVTVNKDDDNDVEIIAGTQIKNTNKLLSWECFNLILLGLTNEIIELGAKPNIKVIVLQIWVRYLQHIKAAFTSKQFKKLPKLNVINNVDCSILYGVDNIKHNILQAKTGINCRQGGKSRIYKKRSCVTSESSASVITASQKRSRLSRKLRRLDNSTRDSVSGVSDDVSLLQRSQKPSRIKVKLTKKVKTTLKLLPSMTDDLSTEETTNLLKNGKKCWDRLKDAEKKNCINIKKLISIIQLALMINNDDIFMSDILRWIREGHLHVNRIDMFLPENVVHGIYNICKMVNISSRRSLNLELAQIFDVFKINYLPNIDFKKLVIRFCDELQLPSDFTHFVCKLVLISPPDLKLIYLLNDIEIKAMSYILFAAKFLFTLDGNTENLSSDFAEKVNLSNKIDTKLFNWNEYVEYIECRNSVISEYNYMFHKDLYGNSIRKTQLFINDWNIKTSTMPIVKAEQLSKALRQSTECLLKSLPRDKKEKSYREIPASTKPLSSTLKWIFEYYSEQLSDETKRILKQNFIQTDILYLTDKNRIQNLSDKCNIPIKVNCNMPLHYTKQVAAFSYFTDIIYHSKMKTFTNVQIIDEPLHENKQNKTLHSNFIEEIPNTIFLGTGINYWYLYIEKLQNADINESHTILKQQLPYSFFWFMQQCGKILDCHQSALYLELLHLEDVFLKFIEKEETSNQATEFEEMLSNITL